MEIIKDIVKNYQMGFITSYEFIQQYMDVLKLLGADKELSDTWNGLCEPLAQHLCKIVDHKGQHGAYVSISQFNKEGGEL